MTTVTSNRGGPALAGLSISPPEGKPRVRLRIRLPDRTLTAEIAAKSLRKAQKAIREAGANNIVLVLEGRLIAGDVIARGRPRRIAEGAPECSMTSRHQKPTMGRFQQGVANERYALVATPAGATYLIHIPTKGG